MGTKWDSGANDSMRGPEAECKPIPKKKESTERPKSTGGEGRAPQCEHRY
jgi:hypothetical protein